MKDIGNVDEMEKKEDIEGCCKCVYVCGAGGVEVGIHVRNGYKFNIGKTS